MAAICLKDTGRKNFSQSEINDITQQCKELLPNYARPRFLRLQDEFEITSTFKQRKVTLQKEGFDINLTEDKMYYLDPKSHTYLPLNSEVHQQIVHGDLML